MEIVQKIVPEKYTKSIHAAANNTIVGYNQKIYEQILALYDAVGYKINFITEAGEQIDTMTERIFVSTKNLIKNEIDVISQVSSQDCISLSNSFPFKSNKMTIVLQSAYELVDCYFVKDIVYKAISGELYTTSGEVNIDRLKNANLNVNAMYNLDQPGLNAFQAILLFMLAALTESNTLSDIRFKTFNANAQDYYNPKVGPNIYEVDIPKNCCNQITKNSVFVIKAMCKMYVLGLGYAFGGSRDLSELLYPPHDCSSFVSKIVQMKYLATTTHIYNNCHNNCGPEDEWCLQVSKYLYYLKEVTTSQDILGKIEPGDVYLKKTQNGGHTGFVNNVYECIENNQHGACVDVLQFNRDIKLVNGNLVGIDGAGHLVYFVQDQDMIKDEKNPNWHEINFLRPIKQQFIWQSEQEQQQQQNDL